jgi:hypothetical protein
MGTRPHVSPASHGYLPIHGTQPPPTPQPSNYDDSPTALKVLHTLLLLPTTNPLSRSPLPVLPSSLRSNCLLVACKFTRYA